MSETNTKNTETILKVEIDPTGIVQKIADTLSIFASENYVSVAEHMARVRDLLEANNRLIEAVRAERRKNEALVDEMRSLRRYMYRDTTATTD